MLAIFVSFHFLSSNTHSTFHHQIFQEYIEVRKNYDDILEQSFENAKQHPAMRIGDWLDSVWSGFFQKHNPMGTLKPTGISMDKITSLGEKFSTPPGHMNIHAGLKRVFKGRAQMLQNGVADWAIGEGLAFGSLLTDGIHVRLSGQDVERGELSQMLFSELRLFS